MRELKERRTLTSRTSVREDERFVSECHAGLIHYDNKLGVGDGEKRLRQIDHTLKWDQKRQGWYFDFHSFHPFLPLHADEWVSFRDLFDGKDQTVEYRAECEHVKGERFDSLDGVSEYPGVLYPDAFGEGIDFLLYFTRSALVKAVRVREGYEATGDLSFRFQVRLPKGKRVRRADQRGSGYDLDVKRDKRFDTLKTTYVGDDAGDGREWYTHLRPFLMWDTGDDVTPGRIEPVPCRWSAEGGNRKRTYLTKTIPLSFLKDAKGDVLTDTTTQVYSGSGDGHMPNNGLSTFSAWRSASAATHDPATTGTSLWAPVYYHVGNYYGGRALLPFDTSGIPDNDTVSEYDLYLCCHTLNGLPTAGSIEQDVVTTSLTSLSAKADFALANWGTTSEGWFGTSQTVGVYDSTTVDDTAIPINKTGTTYLGLRASFDLDNSAPTNSKNNDWRSSESSDDPYLSITHAPDPVGFAVDQHIEVEQTIGFDVLGFADFAVDQEIEIEQIVGIIGQFADFAVDQEIEIEQIVGLGVVIEEPTLFAVLPKDIDGTDNTSITDATVTIYQRNTAKTALEAVVTDLSLAKISGTYVWEATISRDLVREDEAILVYEATDGIDIWHDVALRDYSASATDAPTVGEIDAELSSVHGSGAWTGGGATVEEIDTELSTAHGSGAWTTGADLRGSGADLTTITVNDDDGDPVADAEVWITSDADGATVVAGTLTTDDSGEATFLLDDGVTYYCWRRKGGTSFDNPQTFVASAD